MYGLQCRPLMLPAESFDVETPNATSAREHTAVEVNLGVIGEQAHEILEAPLVERRAERVVKLPDRVSVFA